MRLDYLVILVRDLDLAAADYERLGFAVTQGSKYADGLTRNALIPLEDGSFFELVSFLNPGDAARRPDARSPGPLAVDLASEAAARELDLLLAHGVSIRLRYSAGKTCQVDRPMMLKRTDDAGVLAVRQMIGARGTYRYHRLT